MTLDEFRKADADPGNFGNTFWNLDAGHHLNLLEEAIERLDHLERELERLNASNALLRVAPSRPRFSPHPEFLVT